MIYSYKYILIIIMPFAHSKIAKKQKKYKFIFYALIIHIYLYIVMFLLISCIFINYVNIYALKIYFYAKKRLPPISAGVHEGKPKGNICSFSNFIQYLYNLSEIPWKAQLPKFYQLWKSLTGKYCIFLIIPFESCQLSYELTII